MVADAVVVGVGSGLRVVTETHRWEGEEAVVADVDEAEGGGAEEGKMATRVHRDRTRKGSPQPAPRLDWLPQHASCVRSWKQNTSARLVSGDIALSPAASSTRRRRAHHQHRSLSLSQHQSSLIKAVVHGTTSQLPTATMKILKIWSACPWQP